MANQFNVGSIVEGKISQIKPFGAFVQLDATTRGLVHISQVSHNFVKDINEVISVGDEVKVKILSIEEDGKKISLSIKQAIPFEKKEDIKKQEFRKTEEPSPSIDLFSPNKGNAHLEDLLKEFTRQSNERHADINKRLKR